MIIATCKHQVEEVDDLIQVALMGWTRENTRCVDYVSYCQECYERALAHGEVLETIEEQESWLMPLDGEE